MNKTNPAQETPSQEKIKMILFWRRESQNNDFFVTKNLTVYDVKNKNYIKIIFLER